MLSKRFISWVQRICPNIQDLEAADHPPLKPGFAITTYCTRKDRRVIQQETQQGEPVQVGEEDGVGLERLAVFHLLRGGVFQHQVSSPPLT